MSYSQFTLLEKGKCSQYNKMAKGNPYVLAISTTHIQTYNRYMEDSSAKFNNI